MHLVSKMYHYLMIHNQISYYLASMKMKLFLHYMIMLQ